MELVIDLLLRRVDVLDSYLNVHEELKQFTEAEQCEIEIEQINKAISIIKVGDEDLT